MYTDTIAVVVLNREKLDALLKGKWEKMKQALVKGDVEGGLGYLIPASRDLYRNVLAELGPELLTDRLSSIYGLKLDIFYGRLAECGALRDIDGVVYSYPVIFIKDADGIWKIKGF